MAVIRLSGFPASFFGWLFCNSSFRIPPGIYTVLNGLKLKSVFFSPVGKRFCFTEGSYKSIGSCISVLLGRACPSAVFRGVPAVVINPIKGVAVWSAPHVGNKVGKPILTTPPVANANPSTTVIFELSKSAVVAPVAHLRPRGVERVVFTTPNVSIGGERFYVDLSTKATARHCVPTSKRVGVNRCELPALAGAEPFSRSITFNTIQTLDGKPAKSHSGKVYESAHEGFSKFATRRIVFCKSLGAGIKDKVREAV